MAKKVVREIAEAAAALATPIPATPRPVLTLKPTPDPRMSADDIARLVRQAEKAVGRGPIDAAQAALARAWGDPEARRAVRWPLSLRVGRL